MKSDAFSKLLLPVSFCASSIGTDFCDKIVATENLTVSLFVNWTEWKAQ